MAATVDVRDMLCAQALAQVAKAAGQLAPGAALRVAFNRDDVAHDLDAWVAGRGYQVVERAAGSLTFHR